MAVCMAYVSGGVLWIIEWICVAHARFDPSITDLSMVCSIVEHWSQLRCVLNDWFGSFIAVRVKLLYSNGLCSSLCQVPVRVELLFISGCRFADAWWARFLALGWLNDSWLFGCSLRLRNALSQGDALSFRLDVLEHLCNVTSHLLPDSKQGR